MGFARHSLPGVCLGVLPSAVAVNPCLPLLSGHHPALFSAGRRRPPLLLAVQDAHVMIPIVDRNLPFLVYLPRPAVVPQVLRYPLPVPQQWLAAARIAAPTPPQSCMPGHATLLFLVRIKASLQVVQVVQ